jgi:hypothetical protein
MSDVQHQQALHMYLVSVTLCNKVLVMLIRTYICTLTNNNNNNNNNQFCKKTHSFVSDSAKVKLFPYTPWRHLGSEGIPWPIINLGNRWTKVASFMLKSFYPKPKNNQVPTDHKERWNQSRSELSWEEEYLLALPGNESRFFRPPAHILVTVATIKRSVASIKFQVMETGTLENPIEK